jgi:hypothetical protein
LHTVSIALSGLQTSKMDSLDFEGVCRFCLTNRTKGYGVSSFQIDETIQRNFENVTNEKVRNSLQLAISSLFFRISCT